MMRAQTKIILLFVLLVFSYRGASQNIQKVDSLNNLLINCINDTCRCRIYIKLGDLYEQSFPDTAIYYYKKCLKIAENKKMIGPAATSYKYIGIVHYNQGKYNESVLSYLKAIDLFK